MAGAALSLELDGAETRIARARMVLRVDGRAWDPLRGSALVEGVARTGLLMPVAATDAWQGAGGRLERFARADYTLANPDRWRELNRRFAGDLFLESLGVNEGVTYPAVWPANQPFVLSWFSYGAGSERVVTLEVGLGTGSEAEVRLRFWSDGKCEVWRNGAMVGQGNLFERRATSQSGRGASALTARSDRSALAGRLVEVWLLPSRGRDLLLASNQGGGFCYTFAEIDPADRAANVTGAGTLFWHVPVGKALVQAAPLRFAQTGTLLSRPLTWREAPGAGESPVLALWADAPDGSSAHSRLVEEDGETPFVPDGVRRTCRIAVDLAGDGTVTPWVYGASATIVERRAATHSADATALDPWVRSAELQVPEAPAGLTFTVMLRDPAAIEAAGAAQLRTVGNRPLAARIGDVTLLAGRTQPVELIDAPAAAAQSLTLSVRDGCAALERCRIMDPEPFDGMELTDALTLLLGMGGDPTLAEIEPIDFTLPLVGPTSDGEFALMPSVGDTPLDWIERLIQAYAGDAVWGWAPGLDGARFCFALVATLNGAAAKRTLYAAAEEARAGGGALCRALRTTVLPAEANEVCVTGRDPRTGLPIRATYRDRVSQDPILAPADRPPGWQGEPLRYGWVDPALPDLPSVRRRLAALVPRLTRVRRLVEWSSELLLDTKGVPLWRGDCVELDTIGKARILTLACRFELEAEGAAHRAARYTAELLEPESA